MVLTREEVRQIRANTRDWAHYLLHTHPDGDLDGAIDRWLSSPDIGQYQRYALRRIRREAARMQKRARRGLPAFSYAPTFGGRLLRTIAIIFPFLERTLRLP